jgi:hypothetical protein
MLQNMRIQWYQHIIPNYNTNFYLSPSDNHLYQSIPEGYLVYSPKPNKDIANAKIYGKCASFASPDQDIIQSFRAVDVTHDPKHIRILSTSDINHHGTVVSSPCTSPSDFYDRLPASLKKLVGKIQIPPDGGKKIMKYIGDTTTPIMGAADASLKHGNCSHLWIIMTNNPDHIDDPHMIISGAGAVDGHEKYMSSTRGELQGQTAAAIIIQGLLRSHNGVKPQVHFYGDNQGVQSKCSTYTPKKMRVHREPNSYLLLEYHAATKNMKKQAHWVASHQDDKTTWTTTAELKELKLSHESMLNVLCDKMAGEARLLDQSYPDADTLPSEKWALVSPVPTVHKLTCHMDNSIMTTLYQSDMLNYNTKKHGMTEVKLNETRTECLENYLKKQKPMERASTIKLIHKWIPTNAFLYKQRRIPSPCCTRCGKHDETAVHIYSCPDQSAQTERQTLLYNKLKELVTLGMPLLYASQLEDKMTSLLAIMSKHEYRNTIIACGTSMNKAIIHQNIIGWDNML